MPPTDVFLAGATGAIGAPLLRLLTERGHRVYAMTRSHDKAAGLWDQGAIPVVVDALDPHAVAAALRATRPGAVIHQLTDLPAGLNPAAMAEALQRNAHLRRVGTANLAQGAALAGVRHFIAQSIAWAYRPGNEPHAEDAPLDTEATGTRATSIQGVIALESAVLGNPGIGGCVLRYGHIYGPGTGADTAAGKAIPLHVDAAAWAALLALEQGATGVYNVAEPNATVSTDKVRAALRWRDDFRT